MTTSLVKRLGRCIPDGPKVTPYCFLVKSYYSMSLNQVFVKFQFNGGGTRQSYNILTVVKYFVD